MSKSTPFLLRAFSKLLGYEEDVYSVSHSFKTINGPLFALHSGLAWTKSRKHVVGPAGGIFDHLIIPNSGAILHLNGYAFNTTKGPSDTFLYESPFTDVDSYGTDISSQFANHNRDLAIVAPFIAHEGPFINANSIGTPLDYGLMEQVEGAGAKISAGDISGTPVVWHLNTQKQYLVRFVNNHVTDSATIQCRILVFVP